MLRFVTGVGVLAVVSCLAATSGRKTPWQYPAPTTAAPVPDGESAPPSAGQAQGGPLGLAVPRLEPAAQLPYSPYRHAEGGFDAETDLASGEQDALYLRWPVPATGVNSLFGPRTDPMDGQQRVHAGLDLEASYGTPVVAAADGIVVRAGWNSGHGRHVVIAHPAGYRSCYSHLSQIIALPGETVKGGQAVGLVGNSGRSTGPHLHFELLRHDVHLDPLDFLGTPLPTE